jgi:hypothetical protein
MDGQHAPDLIGLMPALPFRRGDELLRLTATFKPESIRIELPQETGRRR